MCRLKISASTVELGFEDDFWDGWDSFLSTVCLLEVVYLRISFQRQTWNWASWMIFGSHGPRFRQRFMRQQ